MSVAALPGWQGRRSEFENLIYFILESYLNPLN